MTVQRDWGLTSDPSLQKQFSQKGDRRRGTRSRLPQTETLVPIAAISPSVVANTQAGYYRVLLPGGRKKGDARRTPQPARR